MFKTFMSERRTSQSSDIKNTLNDAISLKLHSLEIFHAKFIYLFFNCSFINLFLNAQLLITLTLGLSEII